MDSRIKIAMAHTLGNSSFCTKDEALNFARSSGKRHGWITLINRDDVSPEEAIRYTKESKHWVVWIELLKNESVQQYLQQLSAENAVSFCEEISDNRPWEIILKRPDIPMNQALNYAKKIAPSYENDRFVVDWRYSDPNLWRVVFGRTDIPLADAIDYVKEFKLDASSLW